MKPSIPLLLLIRSTDGIWTQMPCRDFEEVRRIWSARIDAAGDAGILCSGPDNVSPGVFDSVAEQNAGRMLLSGELKSRLPQSFETAAEPVATVEGIRLFADARGWGNAAGDPDMDAAVAGTTMDSVAPAQQQQDWLAAFVRENPDTAESLSVHGIRDEDSWLARESELQTDIRRRLGVFRTYSLMGDERADPCELARAVPAWLRGWKLNSMNLPAPAEKFFADNNVLTVQDLSTWRGERLLEQSGFAGTTVHAVFQAIDDELRKGPLRSPAGDGTAEADSLFEEFRRSLAGLTERERDILTRRLGFERETETLQQISDDHGLTKERIRQLESRAYRKSRHPNDWRETLEEKMAALLKDRQSPLTVSGMEKEDLWFKGVSSHPRLCANLVGTLFGEAIHLIESEGDYYFGYLEQKAWERLVHATAKKLRSRSDERWSETELRAYVREQLPPEAREFADLLWRKLSPGCHFATLPDGTREFSGYGHYSEQLVKAILTDSDKPLHFKEITASVNRMAKGKRYDMRTILNIAVDTYLLFAPGIYGLRKHLHLNDAQLATILEMAESIIFSQPERKWHASEVLSALRKRTSGDIETLDKYTLDIVLAGSKRLTPLRRMIWTASDAEPFRISIHQEVVSLLEKAGGPLSTEEIRKRLHSRRGVRDSLVLVSMDPLISLRKGLWGLNDRDMPVNRERQQELVEMLVGQLEERQRGIHEGELREFLPLDGCPSRTFMAIAAQDVRLRKDTGWYIHLAKWGKPGRQTNRPGMK